jgi:glycerophosphoryl diester phosphodiesterase
MKLHLLALTTVASLTMSTQAVQIIGHRGASHDAPENTLSSFKLGYKQNADADELDTYLTKDGKAVVMHDATTKRTGGVDKKIVNQTYEELSKIDIGKFGDWKDKGFSEKVPLLSEAVALIPDGKRFFLEIKCGPEIIPALEQTLKDAGKQPVQTPIIGFGYETMQAIKAKLPHLKVYWLVAADKKTKEYPSVESMIAKVKAANLDGLDLNSGFPIDKEFVKKVHAANLEIYTWTVDDVETAKKEMDAGVDGITTNRPGWMREQLGL